MKLLIPPPRWLTKSRHLLTFLGKLRFAGQEDCVLIRLPKALTVLATLLLAVLAVSIDAGTAAAHPNHAHQVLINSTGSGFSAPTEKARQWSQGHTVVASVGTQNEFPDQHGKSDCCCGSVVCHAGVTLTVDVFPFLSLTGARLMPEPSSGQPQRDSSGLERPPRTLDIA